MESSKKLITIFLSTVLLFGCGPSPEEIAEQEREQERLAEEARLLEQKKAELEALGNWRFGFYIDEFGDETNEAFISQTVRGTFSNTATSGADLVVGMYISIDDDGNVYSIDDDGNVYQPFFRLYERDRRNPIIGDNYGWGQSNNLACKVKLPDNEIDRHILHQSEGDDYFTMSPSSNVNTLLRNMINRESYGFEQAGTAQAFLDDLASVRNLFETVLVGEDKVSFACESINTESLYGGIHKYQFRFDFRGYKKALDCYRYRNSCEAFWDIQLYNVPMMSK